MLDLLGQYSNPNASAPTQPRQMQQGPSGSTSHLTSRALEGSENRGGESRRESSLRVSQDEADDWGRALNNRELLDCVVEALISLYRLGVLRDVFDKEAMDKQFLPLFAGSSSSDSTIVSLLSLANCLCIEPELLNSFLETSILGDIATSITEQGVQSEDLYTQTAELLRVALLHEDAQE
ncbi:hypothetical protein BESB_020910 [Besnoitia besnoiti]|uniref:Uncharacterized protein n=1 Tax=Besnoitia besnoiti TaxID=94643 RepID=A0A2A9M9U5_BESBE|nr:hypothetical protein BESB_020910 [Besnoitia besnoiti]PFH32150.1 hypothetical protein BESB_020910 [Besnoitia besnoiti]